MLALAVLLALQTATSSPAVDPLAPLMTYNGTWSVKVLHPFGGGAPGTIDKLESHCTHHTAFVSCEQVVNSKPQVLIIFVPGAKLGQFYTKNVFPSGLSGNRGDLTIAGDHWTYLDKAASDGKATLYRVENTFSGPDHIHFEEFESADDGKTWTKTNEGDETRSRP